MTLFLPSKGVIKRVHSKQLEKYQPEITRQEVDEGRLGAALAWPRLMVTTGNGSDIFDVSVSILVGLLGEKPFAVGNIRLAFTIAVLTIRRNGWVVDISNDESLRLISALKLENISEEKASDFLRRKSLRLPQRR
ncbi:hypothetical protein [Sneathiella aquimaris]|uniref:hypothetical protein n=1 Tax=Sneathiella aquimaris TaxID=2599305 RepID=UPI00146D18FA|nr:hypothetical protein [Sneathiella aquimaris]